MRKKLIILITILIVAVVVYANTQIIPLDLTGTRVDPGNVQTARPEWVVIDETTAAGTEPNDLAVTERTYQFTKVQIDGAGSGIDKGEISIFDIPRDWNIIRFRILAEGGDTEDVVYNIYAGTLGDGNRDIDSTTADCELALVGTLTAVIGTQSSIHHQITFTSGGPFEPLAGDIATGNSSAETAVVVSKALSGGAWADGDAAGTIQYTTKSGTFTNSETISITRAGTTVSANSYTHAASDLLTFEIADTLSVTESDWDAPSGFTTKSPAGNNRVAVTNVDLLGADVIVAVPTTADSDCKLLARGY